MTYVFKRFLFKNVLQFYSAKIGIFLDSGKNVCEKAGVRGGKRYAGSLNLNVLDFQKHKRFNETSWEDQILSHSFLLRGYFKHYESRLGPLENIVWDAHPAAPSSSWKLRAIVFCLFLLGFKLFLNYNFKENV